MISEAASYNIYDNGKLIASGITDTSYKVTGLAAGTDHSFTVSAIVNGTESQQSASQMITTAVAVAADHGKYMEGYPDDTFKPERNVTREEVAMILYRVYHLSDAAMSDMNYSDVSKDDWSASAIAAVTKTGFMIGYPDGTFLPTQSITREEMAGVVARLKPLQGIATDAFSDISGSWARDAINSVSQAGILKGHADGAFHPNSNTTRAEAITIMNRLLNRGPLTGVNTPAWSDVSPNYWAYGDIEEASTDHHYVIQDKTERLSVLYQAR